MAGSLTKLCGRCGSEFRRRHRDSEAQWDRRVFCSATCSNRSKATVPLHVRFWRCVDRRADGECWPWTGARDDKGYGKISFGGRADKVDIKAHRLSFELRYGLIPDGAVICHTCDNRSCVNPSHLYAGSQKDNARDMVVRGRVNPVSQLNLRPGAPGHHGAGPRSRKDLGNVVG